MEYTNYKGFNISKIGMGCYSLADANGKINIDDFKYRLKNSLELGVNFFDTTDIYNGSEQILGEIIKPYRYDVYISTKVNLTSNIMPMLYRSYLKTNCENTLDKLKTDYIDIYSLNIYNPKVPIEETIYVLEELIREGKIRKYGISNFRRENSNEYLKKASVFSIIMKLTSLAYNSLYKTLDLCKENNIKAIISIDDLIYSNFNNKHISYETHTNILNHMSKNDYYKLLLKITRNINRIAKYYNKTNTQIAISWILSHPEIVCVLINPLAHEPLNECAEGITLKLSKEHLNELSNLLNKNI